jgi:hypothetical protein
VFPLFKENDFGPLVQPSQAGRRRGPTGHPTDNDKFSHDESPFNFSISLINLNELKGKHKPLSRDYYGKKKAIKAAIGLFPGNYDTIRGVRLFGDFFAGQILTR